MLLFTRYRAAAARYPSNTVMGRASGSPPSGGFSMRRMPLL
ncbi:hypothetical protein AALC16_08680 [Lachnospiraceae bacterium 29-91]|nr:hypothetical protein [uncultured Schaedlerella sp.]